MSNTALLPLFRKVLPAVALAAAACAPAVEITRRPIAPAAQAVALATASADERALQTNASAARTISVLPFTMSSSDTTLQALGYGFADLLLTDLAVSHQLTLVERMHLNEVRQELELSASDRTDRPTALKLGRLVSARQLVLGSLEVSADRSLQFDTDVATVSTGATSTALAGRSNVDHLFDAKRQLALRLFAEMGIALTADELHALDQIVAPSFNAFVVFSQGVRDEAKGDLSGAAANYSKAATIDPKFTLAAQHAAQAEARASQAALRATAATGAANNGASVTSDAAPTKAEVESTAKAEATKEDAAKADPAREDAAREEAAKSDAARAEPPRDGAMRSAVPARSQTTAGAGAALNAAKAPTASSGVAASHSKESASKPTLGRAKPESAKHPDAKKTVDSTTAAEKTAKATEKSDDASDEKKPQPAAKAKTKTMTKTKAAAPVPVAKKP